MRKSLSTLARRALKRIGFVPQADVSHIAPIDLRGLCRDPLDAASRTQGLAFLIEVPLARLRDMHPIVPSWDSNPYFLTAKEYIENNDLVYGDTPLRHFFETVTPKNAAEILESRSQALVLMSPLEANLPWRECGPPARQVKLKRAERQAREHGVPLSQADGDYSMGPVSRAKGEFEFARLTRVTDSIRQHGYAPPTRQHNISGQLMEADGDWAVMIASGTHRAAALYALGWSSVPVVVKVDKTARRRELANWTSVRNGHITPAEARAFFDRVLRGEDPAWLKTYWRGAMPGAAG